MRIPSSIAVAGHIGKYAACLLLAVAALAQTARSQTTGLLGEWLNGSAASTNFEDVSGYSLATNHPVMLVGAGNFVFTNDVPTGKVGQSLFFYNGDTGLAVSNSSDLDPNYDTTFDNKINNAFTVTAWAKGWPTSWSPFVSKWGESEGGWQLRVNGTSADSCFTIRATNEITGFTNVGVAVLGQAVFGNPDDMATTTDPSDDAAWHLYVGTYDESTGIRSLYVDAKLAAQEVSNNVPYILAADEHLCIGAKDVPPGNTFGNFSTLQVFDVRVYDYALTDAQVQALYGVIPPFAGAAASASVFAGQTAQLAASVSGTPPLWCQWLLNGTPVSSLPNSTNFTGVYSNTLTILSVLTNDTGSYQLVVTNLYGSATSAPAMVSIEQPALVGHWFNGSASLADVSGYQPAGTHDGYGIGSGNYVFTNNVPPGETGQSLLLYDGASAIAISNSSTSDLQYTNTFDNVIHNSLTVAFWSQGLGMGSGANWSAWVAKDGYNNDSTYDGVGWSVGTEGWSEYLNFDMEGIDAGGITYTVGDGLWGNGILEAQHYPVTDGNWHFYAATYDSVTGIRNVYYDGALVDNQLGDAAYKLGPTAHLTIGAQEQTVGLAGFVTGNIFDVRVYNYALSSTQVGSLMPDPVITAQAPQSMVFYVGETAEIRPTAYTHSTPVTNDWQLNGVTVTNGAYGASIISGADSSALTIANVTPAVQGVYRLTISDPNGAVTSSNTTLTVVGYTAPAPATNLVGAWLAGGTNLADTSGYSLDGLHDGFAVSETNSPGTNYVFTNDVPPFATGYSLWLKGNTAIAISNSSDLDPGYVNTFDDGITNAFSVAFWAKGYPGGWDAWVSKYGEGPGWQFRDGGDGQHSCFTVRGTGGTVVLGTAVYGNSDDMRGTVTSEDENWHFYAGTYSSVTGIRCLYVDGVLSGQETNDGPYNVASDEYLTIGGKDTPPGDTFSTGGYFTGEIYGVRIYNTALTAAQVNSFLIPPVPAVPVFSGKPFLNGNQFILGWSSGTLLQATNLAGPWTPTPGATSPYTNTVSGVPRLFFRLSSQ